MQLLLPAIAVATATNLAAATQLWLSAICNDKPDDILFKYHRTNSTGQFHFQLLQMLVYL